MSAFLSLLIINLNLNFGISALKYRYTREGKPKWEPVLIAAGILVGAVPLAALYILMTFGVFVAGKALNQPEMVITVSFVAAQVIIMIFGIFYTLGSFYFSRDLNILIPLPLRPYEVLGSKLLVIMLNEYLTVLPLLLPPLIVYGTGTGQGVFYWLKGIAIIAAVPAIPLTAGALFIVLLMRMVNLRRRKDLLVVLGGFLGIFLAFGINLVLSRLPRGGEQELLNSLFASNGGIVDQIGKRFPPAIWATRGLSQPGLGGTGYFLLFICVSLLLFLALLWLGNRIFYKSVLSGQEVARRARVATGEQLDRRYAKAVSPVIAVCLREWKILLRTPVYALNGLVGSITGPLLIVFMLFLQRSNEEGRQLFEKLSAPEAAFPVALAGLGLMLFTGGVNIVSATSISREGSAFWISKMLPMSPREQVTGKFLNGFAVSALGVLATAVILAAFIGVSLPRVLTVTLIALLAAVVFNSAGLMLDLLHPKLKWNSEQEAMKQNINGMFILLITMLFTGLLAVPAAILLIAGAAEWIVFAALILLAAAAASAGWLGMLSLADNRYGKLEA